MQSNIPYGTQWIRDLVPGVSWDAGSQSIRMPDGSTLPKSAYTIVDSKAYVKPEAVSKYAQPSAPQTQQQAPVQSRTASSVPSGNVWIRDLVPNVSWDQSTRNITLPTGDVLTPNMYTMVNGQAYVNPTALASFYQPKPITPESMQPWIGQLTKTYQPMLDNQQDRLNKVIASIQEKLDANIQGLNSQADYARTTLQGQETRDSEKLRNQAIARGTYTSGLADYDQRKLGEAYAPQYQGLEQNLASAIAQATASANSDMTDVGNQASALEDSFMNTIIGLVNNFMTTDQQTRQQQYENILNGGNTALAVNQADITNALARTEMFGRVVTEADAKALGVPIGTSSLTALAAASKSSGGGSGGGTGGGEGGGIDLNGLSTDQKRSFDAALKIWEQTGVAPDNPVLKAYGIPAGTAYTAEIAAQLEQDKSVSTWADKITTKFPSIRGINAEAASRALTYTNGSVSAALQWLNQNKDELMAQGVNIDTVRKAINSFTPATKPKTQETPSWEFKWNDPSTWFD